MPTKRACAHVHDDGRPCAATPMTAGNPYAMPFLMPADVAAARIANAIAARRRFYVLPWQMAVVGALLRCLPRPLYDLAFARAPHKPRRGA